LPLWRKVRVPREGCWRYLFFSGKQEIFTWKEIIVIRSRKRGIVSIEGIAGGAETTHAGEARESADGVSERTAVSFAGGR
jgi:hypothetical protein